MFVLIIGDLKATPVRHAAATGIEQERVKLCRNTGDFRHYIVLLVGRARRDQDDIFLTAIVNAVAGLDAGYEGGN